MGVLPQGVAHHDRAGEPAVDADEDLRLAQVVVRVERARRVLGAGIAALAQPARAADRDAPAVDAPLDPLAAPLLDMRRRGEHEAALLRRVDKRFREHVRGQLVDRGGEPQQLVRADPVEGDDPLDRGLSERQRAGLVEQHRARLAELLDHAAALDDHAAPRGAGDAGDQRDRRGQDQRARRRDDHHGDEAHRVPRHRPGEPGHPERERQEEGGVAVGHADEGRALRLGPADEPHDRRVGALRGGPRRAQIERLAGVRRAASQLAPGGIETGSGSPVSAASSTSASADRDAVDGNHLSGADDDDVSGAKLVDRHLLDRARLGGGARSAAPARAAWSARAAPAGRVFLERVSAGKHHGDNRAGQVLARRERRRHRDERDRVDADVAPPERARDRPGERHEHRRRRRRPDGVRRTVYPSRRRAPPMRTPASAASASRRRIIRPRRSRRMFMC